MFFLVDGYNVTMADPDTRRLPRDAQREALVSRLATRLPHLLGQGRAVVFFDGGPSEGCAASETRGPVDVRYCRGRSADDAIVEAAASSSEQLTVVSSDRELKDRVRSAAGAGVVFLGASSLFENGPPKRRKRRGGLPRDVGMPPGANRINEELKKVWGLEPPDAEDGD